MPRRRKLLAKTTASVEKIDLILRAEHSDPFQVLGAHPVTVRGKPAVAIRAFLPNARLAWVVIGSVAAPLRRVHRDGFFERVFPREGELFPPYRLRARSLDGTEWEFEDPYRFPAAYRVGVPVTCFYREVLNTDATLYGGSGVTNAPGRPALRQPWHNQPCRIELTLPPLGVAVLKPECGG